MLRCMLLTAACVALHVSQTIRYGLENTVPLAEPYSGTLVWHLKWVLTLCAVVDLNAVLNAWAENRWAWKNDASGWIWEKEVAVVTGGSKGIGACVAKQLAQHGVTVAVLDVEALSSSFSKDDLKLIRYYPCDITSQGMLRSVAEAIRSDLGSPSILINNAGIGNADTILDVPIERVRKLFDINILSHWSTVKEFLPDMLARKKGHVVSVASLSSFVTITGAVDYSCTKSALLSFHEGLTQELKHRYQCPQIKTTIVHPNWTKSTITSHPAMQAGFKKLGIKLLEAEDVAEAIVRQIVTAKSGQLILGPKMAPRVRALPTWLQEVIRDSQAHVVSGQGTTAAE